MRALILIGWCLLTMVAGCGEKPEGDASRVEQGVPAAAESESDDPPSVSNVPAEIEAGMQADGFERSHDNPIELVEPSKD